MATFQWNFGDIFDFDKEISALSFDKSGNLLAFGDYKGNVYIVTREVINNVAEYNSKVTFKSHKPCFDYLHSAKISEKINKIEWLPQINSNHNLLVTNDIEIKLYRLREIFDVHETSTTLVYCRKNYESIDSFSIHSLSVNSDQETFLSSDELRIKLWNFEYKDELFNLVNLMPDNSNNLEHIITCVKFHPFDCSSFAYSLSSAVVRINDMREKVIDNHFAVQLENVDGLNQGEFSFFANFISDINYSHSGTMIMARDYLSLKVWDVRNALNPLEHFTVDDQLEHMMDSLDNIGALEDRFDCSFSPDDNHFLTGSYKNQFRIFSMNNNESTTITLLNEDAERDPLEDDLLNGNNLLFNKKFLHTSWHPFENLLALANCRNVHFFQSDNIPL